MTRFSGGPCTTRRSGWWPLWINTYGGPITQIGLAERIGVLTSRQLGRAVPMHHFRHSAATGMALDDPHHVQLIAALLGHSNLRTGERYYNMASTHDAGHRHQQALRQLREKVAVQRPVSVEAFIFL